MSDVPELPSWTGCALQAESEIVPVWPFAVAVALVNCTVPKSESGSGWQLPAKQLPSFLRLCLR